MSSSNWLSRLFARARRPLVRRKERSRWDPPSIRLERLEDRLAPATYTWEPGAGANDGTLSITLGTGESLTVTEASGTRTFSLTGGAAIWMRSGGTPATGGGAAPITFASGDDIAASITVGNTLGVGTNDVTFAAGTLSSGAIMVTIDAVGTTGNIGVSGGATVSTTGNGNLSFTAADVDISGAIDAGSGMVSLAPVSSAAINLGTDTGFGLTTADLTNITAGTLTIGSATAGAITVSAAINLTDAPVIPTLNLITGANVFDTNGSGADLTVATLNITAQSGIGVADNLETAVSNLSFNNTTNTTKIVNTGALTINAASSTGNGGGGVVRASSPLVINAPMTLFDGDTLEATGSAANDDDLTINADITATGFITLRAGDDILHTGGAISTSGAGNGVSFIADTEGAGGDTDRGGITQSGGTLSATSVAFRSFDSVLYVGTSATSNSVTNLSASVTSPTGSFAYRDANGLTVSTVDSLPGVTTAGGAVLLVSGSGGSMTLNQAVNAGAGTVLLRSLGAISQGATGVITAGGLGVRNDSATPGNNITLTQANDVTSLAAFNTSTTGTLSFTDATGLGVVTVDATALGAPFSTLFTATTGVTANNSVNLTAGGVLDLSQAVNAGSASATLSGSSITQTGTGTRVTGGDVSLTGAGGIGSMTQSVGLSATTLSTSSTATDQFLAEADSLAWNTSSATTRNITLTGGRFDVGAGQTITAATLTVNSGATLGGTGTITGDVTGVGTFAPGNSPGVQTINGNFTPTGTVEFDVNPPAATAGLHYDQYIVSGAVDLSGATLSFVGTPGAVAVNQVATLIDKTGVGAITPPASPAQGTTVTINGNVYRVYYTGGTGNDMVLVEYSATPATVYVDDSFTQSAGQVIADADAGTLVAEPAVFGVTAFTSITAALAAVTSGGTIIVNAGTYAETISLTGTQTLEITGPDTAQTVTISSLTTASGQSVVIEGTSTLQLGAGTIAGTIAGSGSLTKQTASTLTLSGANTSYTGAISVSDGILDVTVNDALGTVAGNTSVSSGATLRFASVAYTTAEPVTLAGGVLASTGTSSLAGPITLTANSDVSPASGSTLTLSGAIDGGFTLRNNGAGTTVFSGGGTLARLNIAAGTARIGTGAGLATDIDVLNSSTFDLNGATESIDAYGGAGGTINSSGTTANFTVGSAGSGNSFGGNANYVGAISGAVNLTIAAGGNQFLGSNLSTFTGTTTVNGALRVTGTHALGAVGAGNETTVASTGTLDFQNVTYVALEDVTVNGGSIATTTGTSSFAGPITLSAATATVSVTGTALTLGGAIGGTQGFDKTGGGLLTLSVASNYSGATNINAGRIDVTGSITSAVAVNSNGTLGGTGSTGAMSATGSGIVTPGTAGTPITQLNTGAASFGGTSVFNVDLTGTTPGTQHDQLVVTGALTITGTPTINITAPPDFVAAPGSVIVLVNATAAGSGEFANLLDGSTVMINGVSYLVDYSGGIDGFDLTLSLVAPTAVYVDQAIDYVIQSGGDVGPVGLSTGDTVTWDTTGTHPSGPVMNLIFGYNAFTTIQAGIGAAAAGTGVVNVAAGTYTENVVLNKSLTLRGAQFGTDARGRITGAPSPATETVLSPATGIVLELQAGAGGSIIDGFALVGSINGATGVIASTTGATDNLQLLNNHVAVATGFTASALFLNKSAIDATFNQNVFVAATGSSQAVFFDGADQFHGLHFTNNHVLRDGALAGTGLFVDGNRNVGTSISLRTPLIQGNLFQNHALGFNGGPRSFANAQIVENTFTGNTGGLAAGPLNSTIARNTFSTNARYGLRLTSFGNTVDPTRGAQNTTVTNNVFTGNATTVDLVNGYGDVLLNDQFNGTQSTNSITNNSLGSAVGVFNLETNAELINFGTNWWGSSANPETAGKILGPAAANIDYTPWLNSGIDTDGVTLGFQGSFAHLHVDDDSAQTGGTGRITEGIALATSQLSIHAGTYAEDVNVNKGITLAPGGFGVVGTVEIQGDLIFSDINSQLHVDIDSSSVFDQINVTGANNNVDLGITFPTLVVDDSGYTAAFGDQFAIITEGDTTVDGTFDNGATVTATDGAPDSTFNIRYNFPAASKNVVLTTLSGTPNIVYVDDDFTNQVNGADADGSGGLTDDFWNFNAFDTFEEAFNAVATGGKIIVLGGNYGLSAAGDFDTDVAQIELVGDTDLAHSTQLTITIDFPVTLFFNTSVVLVSSFLGLGPTNLVTTTNGTINSLTATNRNLSITTTGGTGDVTLNGAVGNTRPLGSLTLGTASNRIGNVAVTSNVTTIGAIGVNAANAVNLGTVAAATIDATAATVTILANQDGTGTEGFTQTATSTVTTTNASANAIFVNVNGSGSAALAALSAANGTVGVLAGGGALTDANTTSLNFTAAALALEGFTGIATTADPFESMTPKFEAETVTGGIFLSNTGDLSIGGVAPTLDGVRVTGAAGGAIEITNAGSISVTTLGETVETNQSAITIRATGAMSDIVTGGAQTAVRVQNTSAAAVALDAGRDLLLGSGGALGNVQGGGSVILDAVQDIIVSTGTFVQAFGTGLLDVEAGRDIQLVGPAVANGARFTTQNGNATFVAGQDFIANTATLDFAVSTAMGGNDIDITAGRNITLSNLLNAGLGDVTLEATAGAITSTSTAIDVSADDLDATAALGIDLDTTINTVTAATTGVGAIVLDESDGITLTSITSADGAITVNSAGTTVVTSVVSTTDDDDNDIGITASTGDLQVATIDAKAAGDVSLNATTGNILDDGVNTNRITGDVLTVRAVAAIGQPGANPGLDTTVASLDAETTGAGPFTPPPSAGIWVSDSNDLTVTKAATVTGVVRINAVGNLAVDTVTATGDDVFLSATGAITDANFAATNVTASRLMLQASGTGIGVGNALETTVSTLAFASGTGGIELVNSGALDITAITAFGTTITGGSGAGGATITTLSPMSITAAFVMGGAIDLTAQETNDPPTFADDFTLAAGVNLQSTGASVSICAGDDILIDTGATLQAFTFVSLEAGCGDLDGKGALTINGSVTSGGNVTMCSEETLTLGSITATGFTVTLASHGGAIVNGTGTTNVTALALAMLASSGIGASGAPILTAVSNLEANTTTGGLFISNTGALAVGGVTPDVSCISGELGGVRVLTSGDLELTSAGTISILLANEIVIGPNNVKVQATGATSDVLTGGDNNGFDDSLGAIQQTGTGSLTVSAGRDVVAGVSGGTFGDIFSTSGTVGITAGGAIVVNASVIGNASATNGLTTNATGVITLNAGLFFTDGADQSHTAGGAFTINGNFATANEAVDSNDGDISITAAGISVGGAIDAGGGDVMLDGTTGAITDTNAGVDRVIGDELFADAATGIDLETDVKSIDAATTGTGAIDIDELDGVALVSVISANGSITVTTGGATLVTSVVSTTSNAANDISITASASDVTIATIDAKALGDVSVQATTGNIKDDVVDTTRITGNALSLTAVRNIGQPTSVTPNGEIDTTVASLTATTTGAGPFGTGTPTAGIWVLDSDALTITSATTIDGTIVIDAGTSLIATSVNAGSNGTARNMRLRALGGNLTVGQVQTSTSLATTVYLDATGSIVDGNAGSNNITAPNLMLKAGAGIGAGDAIDTTVSKLAFESGTGVIELINTGALSIDDLTAFGVTLFNFGDGGATISATTAMSIDESVQMGGPILLTAGENNDGSARGDTLTVNGSGVMVESTGDSITLRAGDDVVVAATANVQANTSVTIIAGFNDLDGTGAATLNGTLVAGTNMDVTAAEGISLNALFATAGTVSLRATTGAITAPDDSFVDIDALALAMKAATGIGTLADPIETIISNLEAETVSGGIFVQNILDGGMGVDLTIGGVTPAANVGPLTGLKVTTSGDINVQSSGNLSVTVAGDTVAGPGDITLLASQVLTVSEDVTGTAAAAGKTIKLTGMGGVTIDNSATVTNSNNAAVTIDIDGTASAAHLEGVVIRGAATIDANAGDITIDGTGAGDTGYGVLVSTAAVVMATGAGKVTINGISTSPGDNAVGVFIDGLNTQVKTENGNLGITGMADGPGMLNQGIIVTENAVVSVSGSGELTLTGTGGTGTSNNIGVVVQSGATVSAFDGPMTIEGTGRGTAATNFGVAIDDGLVESTGAGEITIIGHAALDVTGILAQGAGPRVIDAGTADLTLRADEIDLNGTDIVEGTGQLLIELLTDARGIKLGGAANAAGNLTLTAGDLTALQDGFALVTVGNAAGTGEITTQGNATFKDNVVLQTPAAGSAGINASHTIDAGVNFLLLDSGSTIKTTGAGLYKAGTELLLAVTGIGAAGAPVMTQTSFLEADTDTGGIFISNAGAVQIGGVTPNFHGLEVHVSGDIDFTASGTITLADTDGGEVIEGPNDIKLTANGAASDVVITVDNDAIEALGGSVIVNAGQDILLGTALANQDSDIQADGSVTLIAGRDVTIDGQSDVRSDDFTNNTGGSVMVTAGRDINVTDATGLDASIEANGTAGGDVTLTTGAGGKLTLTAPSTGAVASNSGDVTINADRVLIAAASGITAAGEVTIRQFSAAWGIDLGTGSDMAANTLELSDGELDRISVGTLLRIGRTDNTGNIRFTGQITAPFGGWSTLFLETGGGVVDATLGEQTDLTVSRLAVFASTGIGVGDEIDTALANFEAQTNTGGIFVRNTGALIIGGVTPTLSGLEVLTSGAIDVTAASPLTVIENVVNAVDNVTLTAGDSAAGGDNLTVNAGIQVKSGGGNVALKAGDNLTIAVTALVQTSGAGTILIEVDAGNADLGTGGIATLSGASLDAPAGASVLGNGDDDVFNLSPSPTTPITVNGNAPTTPPGDTLNLDLTGVTGKTLQITERYSATASFTGTTKDLKTVSIETTNVTGGQFDVLLDLAQAKLETVAFGNGSANPDAVRLGLDATGAKLLFDAAQNGEALTGYFSMNLAGARSVSLAGSSDRTAFQLAETAGGLPTFTGNAIGSHNDAGSLPPGTFTRANVGLNVKGSGMDTFSVALTTARNVSYFADLTGGNTEVQNVVRASFEGLAEVTYTGAGASLLTDATLVSATVLTVGEDVAANNGFSQILGNGGFTPARFGGFTQLTVRGGTGAQTMALNALDALDAALTSLVLSGDNAFGTDAAGDTLNVNALAGNRTAFLFGAAGNDTFNVVPGRINVKGGTGANRLVVNTSGSAAPQNISLRNSYLFGGGSFVVTYDAVGGTYSRGVHLATGAGADVVRVISVAGPTVVATGGGNDTVAVPGPARLRVVLPFPVTVNVGTGVNVLNVSDAASVVPDRYDIYRTAILGTGWRVNYLAPGGSFGLLTFTASQRNDIVRVLGKTGTRVIVNAAGGNDALQVFASRASLPAGLEVDGGAGVNSLQTIDSSGGAVIRNFPSGPRSGRILVNYLPNLTATYLYRNINQMVNLNVNSNYVQALYHHILGRAATPAEVASGLQVLATQGRLPLVVSLEHSVTGRTVLVHRWYLMFFGRTPTAAESNPLVQRLLAGQSEETVLGVLLGSSTLPHTAGFRERMVRSYYLDLLRRNPTQQELAMWVNGVLSLERIREQLEVSEPFYLFGY